jgi:hypothetical protein
MLANVDNDDEMIHDLMLDSLYNVVDFCSKYLINKNVNYPLKENKVDQNYGSRATAVILRYCPLNIIQPS